MGGLADLYAVHQDTAYLEEGIKIANKTVELFVTEGGVMREAEVIASQDGALFKGAYGILNANYCILAIILSFSRRTMPHSLACFIYVVSGAAIFTVQHFECKLIRALELPNAC